MENQRTVGTGQGPRAGVLAHPTALFLGSPDHLLTETGSGQILGSSASQSSAALEKKLLLTSYLQRCFGFLAPSEFRGSEEAEAYAVKSLLEARLPRPPHSREDSRAPLGVAVCKGSVCPTQEI